MTYADLVQPLIERRDLTDDQAHALMHYLMSGDATEAQIGGVLLGMRIKGCTNRELAAFATVMRARAALLVTPWRNLVDTCGTGGGKPTFNISTAAAIVASAAGVKIAKHGNRSMSGQGSADVLEALGIPMAMDQDGLLRQLESLGIVFLFAPKHHPAMKHVAKSRKELGLRTFFNQLGPLANPAGAKRQLIGVYDAGLMRSMAEALNLLGAERALLVHGAEGIDEVSPCGPTEVVRLWEGRISTETLEPSNFGLNPAPPEALEPVATLVDAAEAIKISVSSPNSLRFAAIVPSAALAIYLSGVKDDLEQAACLAKEVVSSGAALTQLQSLIAAGETA